jgi:hypothetical protein
MDVCLLCVLSDTGLRNELITRPEGSYQLWRVTACDHESSWYKEAIARAGLQSQRNKHFKLKVLLLHLMMLSYILGRTSLDGERPITETSTCTKYNTVPSGI